MTPVAELLRGFPPGNSPKNRMKEFRRALGLRTPARAAKPVSRWSTEPDGRMVHDAIAVHRIPGRPCLGLPDSNRKQQSLPELRDFIAGLRGVHSVQVNPTNGSILVHWEREMRALLGDRPDRRQFAGGGVTRTPVSTWRILSTERDRAHKKPEPLQNRRETELLDNGVVKHVN